MKDTSRRRRGYGRGGMYMSFEVVDVEGWVRCFKLAESETEKQSSFRRGRDLATSAGLRGWRSTMMTTRYVVLYWRGSWKQATAKPTTICTSM